MCYLCLVLLSILTFSLFNRTNYAFRLAHITGTVIDRNLCPSPDGNYMDTIKIEASIMDLANSMPPDWWRLDLVGGEDTTMQMYERLLPQFFHHQVRTLLHLPFMLKASQDRRYEYNRYVYPKDSAPFPIEMCQMTTNQQPINSQLIPQAHR